MTKHPSIPTTVRVPEEMVPLFLKAEEIVGAYFRERTHDPERGMIEIAGQRYILVRAASLSVQFFGLVRELHGPGREGEADAFSRNLLFDLAHTIGRADAKNFHEKMGLEDPIAKLSAGPVHFAHSGWAFVDISDKSHPSQDDDFYLLYDHPYSFEADAWLQSGGHANAPVCIMNAGYSSGWCEESFGIALVAAEVLCRAKGDPCCRFIMAPPSRVARHIEAFGTDCPEFANRLTNVEVPDLFSRKRLEDELRQISLHDALTQLPNRLLLGDRIRQAIAHARRSRQHACIAMMDLDHFKDVNDTLGHEAGDALLREVARRIVRTLREGDTVARMGGDEFVLVLGELAEPYLDLAADIARRVLASIKEPIDVGGRQLFITGSMGIATFPSDGEDIETLVRYADTAMYQTKSNNRDGYCFFDHEVAEIASTALDLETRLAEALDRNEFVLHYQPIVDLATGAISSVEALVRWNPSSGELVAPDRFVSLAEKTGLIVPIGRWVLREACRQAASWMTSGGKRIAVAVNLSARQLQHPDLVDTVLEALRQSGLDPSLLQLELTESTMLHDIAEAQRKLTQLREHGVLIAVDDFGSGHSSLQHLRSLPIDLLKLDRTFVRNVASDPADAIMVAAVVALAHELGLRVVAEGVETLDQLEYLRTSRWRPAHGRKCDLVQGLYFSGPVPAADITLMIERAKPICTPITTP